MERQSDTDQSFARVVSVVCSNTEIVCALGCAEQLVGVDDHSDHPEDVVAHLPRVGPDLGIDAEAVGRLEPDLVLASLTVPGHEKVIESLEEANLPVEVIAPTSIHETLTSVERIARLLGVEERGRDLATRLADDLEPRDVVADPPSVLVQWWPRPVIAPGRRSWTHDLIERAGGKNALGHEDVESRPLTDEEVRELDPDVIVLSWCGVESHKIRPDVVSANELFAQVKAVQEERVVVVPEALLGRPGPRLVEGLEALRLVVDSCR